MQTDKQQTVGSRLPPLSGGWPIVGALPRYWWRQLDFLTETRERCGDIFRLPFGKSEITLLCHPRHANHVLQRNAANYRNKGEGGFRIAPLPLMKNGLATVERSETPWRQNRRAAQPYFHHERIDTLVRDLIDGIEESLATWGPIDPAVPVDLDCHGIRMAVNVVGRAIFGTSIPPEEADRVTTSFRLVADHLWLGTALDALAFPDWMPMPPLNRYKRAVDEIDGFVQSLVASALRADGDTPNLISILNAQVTEGVMSREQFRSEAITMLVTGFESTAANMGLVFRLLLRSPVHLDRVRAEADAVLGDRRPTPADVGRLTYSRMVIQEALRRFAPNHWIQRVAESDDTIDGFHIPAGTLVAPMIHLIHHHPDVWDEPFTFDPERFLPGRVEGRDTHAWLPFGAGGRKCIAPEFALIEEQLFLSRVLHLFDVEPIDPDADDLHVATTVRARGGVRARLTSRRALP